MKIAVRYFAALRDRRGVSQESLDVDSKTAADLYSLLHSRHGFSLTHSQVRYAVNGQYVESDYELKDGDEVVFIPPVAGG